MKELRLGKEELDAIVPHSGRMSFLSGIVDWGENLDWLVCRARFGEDFLFFDEEFGGVPSYVGFEFMAQSIAALSGLERYLGGIVEKRIGYIMGVRNYKARGKTLPPNEDFEIRIEEILRNGPVVSYRCGIDLAGDTISEGIINAFEPERGEE